jgi:addiction module HigA family antidote
MPMKNPPHIG